MNAIYPNYDFSEIAIGDTGEKKIFEMRAVTTLRTQNTDGLWYKTMVKSAFRYVEGSDRTFMMKQLLSLLMREVYLAQNLMTINDQLFVQLGLQKIPVFELDKDQHSEKERLEEMIKLTKL